MLNYDDAKFDFLCVFVLGYLEYGFMGVAAGKSSFEEFIYFWSFSDFGNESRGRS